MSSLDSHAMDTTAALRAYADALSLAGPNPGPTIASLLAADRTEACTAVTKLRDGLIDRDAGQEGHDVTDTAHAVRQAAVLGNPEIRLDSDWAITAAQWWDRWLRR